RSRPPAASAAAALLDRRARAAAPPLNCAGAKYRAQRRRSRVLSPSLAQILCDCIINLDIAGAAAEVSRQAGADLLEVGVVGQRARGEEHARSADAALGSAALEKGALQ